MSSMPNQIVEKDVVLFAVPKKGRLKEEVMKLLNGVGLNFARPDRLDVAMCKELPVKLVFLPAKDIPSYVMEGDVDLGITGGDVLEETLLAADTKDRMDIKVKTHLGFGKCKLCLQAPKLLSITDPKEFLDKRIVTSFPHLTKHFFAELDKEKFVAPKIREISGSVEAACGLGLADAIVDIVETGTTMRAAGLDVVCEIFESEALLIEKEKRGRSNEKIRTISIIQKRIQGFLTAQRNVMVVYNCHQDSLEKCCNLTQGAKAPTITNLREAGWYSVSSLVAKDQSNTILDELSLAGATDILCMGLVNTRF